MKVAVAHEWLTNWAGSEQVAQEMVDVSGAEQLVASIVEPALAQHHFPEVEVRALWPTSLPAAAQKWQRYALMMMASWASARIEADTLLVSSHFAAHAATLRFDGPSIVYYHTPARILWRTNIELDRLNPALQVAGEMAGLPLLRRWDRFVAKHPTVLLANSTAVACRIERAYGRSAQVVHPPVDIAKWSNIRRCEPTHFVWIGRLVPYKRPDVAIEAARISGEPLVIIGDGPERHRLESTAPANVQFMGHVSERVKMELLASAYALIFPGEEDFGIASIEALAVGVPVLAFDSGGAKDYVRDGLNGIMISEQEASLFANGMRECRRAHWNRTEIQQTAAPFSTLNFRNKLRQVLASVAP